MADTAGHPDRLDEVLAAWAADDDDRRAIASTVVALAAASVEIGRQLALAPLVGGLDDKLGSNASGDLQSRMDDQAHRVLLDALAGHPGGGLRLGGARRAHRTRQQVHPWSWPSTRWTARATWPSTARSA